jgi:hypothetical protein
MAIGSIFLGAVKKFNHQQIETRFTLVILPVKPLYSMVVVLFSLRATGPVKYL